MTATSILEALENSQSLLVALLHEIRPTEEIEKQIIENRDAMNAHLDGDNG